MRINVGFVGCGARALREMNWLSQLDDVHIVAVTDVSETAMQRAVDVVKQAMRSPEALPVAVSTVESLLDRDLDVVYVAIPPHVHGSVEHQILERQCAMVVEKPITNDIGLAREILAHIRSAGIINAVAFQWRYSDAVSRGHEWLQGQKIGLLMANRVSGLPPVAWWRRQDQGGGMLAEQHIHTVDLMRLLAGDVRMVAGFESHAIFDVTQDESVTVADSQVTSLSFDSGAIGSLSNSCTQAHWQHEALNRTVHVVGDHATIDVSANECSYYGRDGEIRRYSRTVDENLEMNRAIIRAVETKNQALIRSDYYDGLKTMAVAYAASRSVTTGQVIDLQQL